MKILLEDIMSARALRKGEIVLECPFCHKGKIKIFHKEEYFQAKAPRISACAKTTYHRILDTYDVLEDCPECGKTKKEVQRALDTGITKELLHEERLAKLKKAGLPTRIEF